MSSKIFIEFLALIIRNRIYNLLKEQMVRRNGRHYKLAHAVTRIQKLILNSFGLDETDIKKSAEEYGKLLNSSQSYINSKGQTTRLSLNPFLAHNNGVRHY